MSRKPSAKLLKIRAEIDKTDDELAKALQRRLDMIRNVAIAKVEQGRPVADVSREKAILERVTESVDFRYEAPVKRFFKELFNESKVIQRKLIKNMSEKRDRVTIAVVGMGLIGGSFYKAGLAAGHKVLGLHHGDECGLDTADFVFVALPIDAIAPWIASHAKHFKLGAVVVDMGGVKRTILEAVAKIPNNGWTFVGGHPMAGRELSGYDNSSAELFVGAPMILTPYPRTPRTVMARLKRLFAELGFGSTVVTTPEKHDAMISFSSQLGHVIASSYIQDQRVKEVIGFSAGSYANMTRIATMDPDGWATLFLSNRDELLKAMDGFLLRFSTFRAALDSNDYCAVKRFILAGAKAKRRELDARQGN